ncbi:DUF3080 family protein [Litorivicinus lipolyticus]|uniref:DUF3080 family protein n=1 Tax=Litorivicinus lipolyticus TaxID=418701 RepID=A0A5Q2Q8D4_9GAMM|nr:DUF3080 family protein [Litorivicinus lipolyticus]QGG80388.1 DUF3080 family protein [Litorivicinus lipolyticus]
MTRWLLGLAAALSVIAALSLRSDPAAAVWDDYANRLGRVLEQPLTLTPVAPVGILTPRSQRRVALTESRTSLGKALALGPCGLVPLIAGNNNSLGKVAPATAELVYTQQALRLARACVAQPPAAIQGTGAEDGLRALIAHRQSLWPQLLSNAVFAAPEFDRYFQSSAAALGPDQVTSTGLGGLDDYLAILGAADAGATLELSALEQAAQRVQAAPTGATWINSQRLARHHLDTLTAAIDAHRLCQGPRTPEQGLLARTVFEAIYLDQVQPMLTTLDQRGRRLHELLSTHQQQTGIVVDWLATDWHPDQLRQATRAHALAWKNLLTACGLPIGTKP